MQRGLDLTQRRKGAKTQRSKRSTNTPKNNERLQYEIVLYWSGKDQAYIAEVPELPGCSADGVTYEETIANVQTVIREWIETARELGRPVPAPRGKLMYA